MGIQLKKPVIWLEIDEKRLRHNIDILTTKVGTKRAISAVIKGNAYGHGLELMGRLLADAGISRMAVYTAEEALKLRAMLSPEIQILILGVTSSEAFVELEKNDIDLMILDLSELKQLMAIPDVAPSLNVHLKFDTGMNRYGIRYDESDEVLSILGNNTLNIKGIASHFSNAGLVEEKSFSQLQLERFKEILGGLNTIYTKNDMEKHMCNTAGLFNYPEAHFDYSRCGIGIMGYYPSVEIYKQALRDDQDQLLPILSFKSRIVSIKDVKAGEYVGYDQAFRCSDAKRIAILPVGYSDGFPYGHSGCGSFVLVGGRRAEVLGRVNMNALIVDITGIQGIEIGDTATLLGRDANAEISVWDWLDWGTDHLYESLTKLRSTLSRVVTNSIPVASH